MQNGFEKGNLNISGSFRIREISVIPKGTKKVKFSPRGTYCNGCFASRNELISLTFISNWLTTS